MLMAVTRGLHFKILSSVGKYSSCHVRTRNVQGIDVRSPPCAVLSRSRAVLALWTFIWRSPQPLRTLRSGYGFFAFSYSEYMTKPAQF
jgi:hypothetical protein